MSTNYSKKERNTVVFNLEFKDADDVAIDITNYTVYFTLKKYIDDLDVDAILQKDVTVHSDPTEGITEITLSSVDTKDLEGNYYYDIVYDDNTVSFGNIVTVDHGIIYFKKSITQRSVDE